MWRTNWYGHRTSALTVSLLVNLNTQKKRKAPFYWLIPGRLPSRFPFPQSLPLSLSGPVGRASLHYTLGEKWLTFIFLWSRPQQGQTEYATGSPKAAPKAVLKPPRLYLGPPVLYRTLSVGPGPQRLHWANGNYGWQLVTLSYSSLLPLGPSGDNGCLNPC